MKQGIKLLNTIISQVGPIFTIEQAYQPAMSIGVNESQLRSALSKLARSGWIERLKRGLYSVNPPFEGNDLHPFAIATALVDPAVISHWSALAHHGLTTQIPSMIQASTTRRVVTPEMRHGKSFNPRGHAVWTVLDWEFEFITIRKKSWFGQQLIWVNQWSKVLITDPERTILDMFSHPEVFGSIQNGMETMESVSSTIDLEKLVTYAIHLDIGSVIKRLGWTLESLNVPSSILEPLASYPVNNYYLLNPAGPENGPVIKIWQVRNNLIYKKNGYE